VRACHVSSPTNCTTKTRSTTARLIDERSASAMYSNRSNHKLQKTVSLQSVTASSQATTRAQSDLFLNKRPSRAKTTTRRDLTDVMLVWRLCTAKHTGEIAEQANTNMGRVRTVLADHELPPCLVYPSSILNNPLRPCLVPHQKIFHPSHRIFGHMHGILNVDKKNKLITQFS